MVILKRFRKTQNNTVTMPIKSNIFVVSGKVLKDNPLIIAKKICHNIFMAVINMLSLIPEEHRLHSISFGPYEV